jgi:hypothetical protein
MELFRKDFVPELNTKNLNSSPNFLTMTHMTLSTSKFRSYGILTIDVAAKFYICTEQRHNGSSISNLGLALTPDVLNTISDRHANHAPIQM